MRDKHRAAFSAQDLLDLYLEMCGMIPNQDDWTEKSLKKNKPRLIRFQRLRALFQAFGIPFELKRFREGEFIDPDNPVYEVFLEKARAELSKLAAEGRIPPLRRIEPIQMVMVFSSLLRYRLRLSQVLSFHAGVFCTTGLFILEDMKVANVNRAIRPQLPIIDNFLTELISPSHVTVTREQLVRDHGYPDVELDEIDIYWS